MTETEVAAFKLAFATASSWSEWCTIAVTVGVFVEFLALFIFSKGMPKPEKWVMGAVTAIIVLGCGGEYVFGDRALVAATRLQDASDLQIADAQRDAANANDHAGQASERAAKIEATAAPRDVHIPTEFKLTFMGTAQPTAVMVVSYAIDAEGARLASDIIDHLQRMDFVVLDNSITKIPMTPLVFGTNVSGPNPYLVSALLQWLNESDLHATERDPPSGSSFNLREFSAPASAIIFVGVKPISP